MSAALKMMCCAVVFVGAAPAQYASHYLSIADAGYSIEATGVTDTNYAMAGQHTAYARVRLYRPTGVRQEVTTFHANRTVTTNSMSVDLDDGTWRAEMDPWEWCYVVPTTYTYRMDSQTKVVDPFVEMASASFSPASIPVKNGNSLITAAAIHSKNCSGTTEICTNITANPSSMTLILAPQPACKTTHIDGGGTGYGTATVSTPEANTSAGTVTSRSYIQSYPFACTVRGSSVSATLQVN